MQAENSINYELPLKNMLAFINNVKDEGTRKVLRIELKGKCLKIIDDFPNEYKDGR